GRHRARPGHLRAARPAHRRPRALPRAAAARLAAGAGGVVTAVGTTVRPSAPDAPPAPEGRPPAGEHVAVARGLRRRFGDREVLAGVDLEIRRDEFVALLGRSGTGKTTLLRTLAGLDADHEGSVRVAAARSVVFQEPRLLPWRRVLPNVV